MNENTNYKRSLWWFAPLLVTQTLFVLSQIWITNQCNGLPEDAQDNCGTAWINLAIVPLEAVALLVSISLALVGTVILIKKYRKAHQRTVR